MNRKLNLCTKKYAVAENGVKKWVGKKLGPKWKEVRLAEKKFKELLEDVSATRT